MYNEKQFDERIEELERLIMNRINGSQKDRMTAIEKNVNRLEEILKEMDSGE